MNIIVIDTCKKELQSFPNEILQDFLDATEKLKNGINLTMPLSRPMPSLGKQVHKLRLKDSVGIYRVIYFIKKKEAIYIIHAFTKKSQKTSKKNIELAQKRIRSLR